MIRQVLRCGSLFFMRLAFGVLPPHDSMVLYDEKKTLHPEGLSVRALAKILRILCQALTFHAKRYNYVKVCHYLSR